MSSTFLVILAAVAVAVIWPLSHFGYRFYAGLVEAENQKHAKNAHH